MVVGGPLRYGHEHGNTVWGLESPRGLAGHTAAGCLRGCGNALTQATSRVARGRLIHDAPQGIVRTITQVCALYCGGCIDECVGGPAVDALVIVLVVLVVVLLLHFDWERTKHR